MFKKEIVLDGESITILINTELEQEFLKEVRFRLLDFLKRYLLNDHITIDAKITKAPTIQKLYTSKEKYDFMVSRNPALKKLKDGLGLDFDY